MAVEGEIGVLKMGLGWGKGESVYCMMYFLCGLNTKQNIYNKYLLNFTYVPDVL